MASVGSGYDLSASTFSPDGRIFQVEYATKAVDSSGTCIGICCREGVVLAVEKVIHSRLLKPTVNRRIATVDLHAGVVSAGLAADGRAIANIVREEAMKHKDVFEEPMPTALMADRLALTFQAYTRYSSVRPFGVATLVAGIDALKGGQLFMVEPSGVVCGYQACAIGKGRQAARTELEKMNLKEQSLEEAVYEAARILRASHDETKDKEYELEISWIGERTGNLHQFVPLALLKSVEERVKAAQLAGMEYEQES